MVAKTGAGTGAGAVATKRAGAGETWATEFTGVNGAKKGSFGRVATYEAVSTG
jgi:hypothetical protein